MKVIWMYKYKVSLLFLLLLLHSEENNSWKKILQILNVHI